MKAVFTFPGVSVEISQARYVLKTSPLTKMPHGLPARMGPQSQDDAICFQPPIKQVFMDVRGDTMSLELGCYPQPFKPPLAPPQVAQTAQARCPLIEFCDDQQPGLRSKPFLPDPWNIILAIPDRA